MNTIENFEKNLSPKRKKLLEELRENNWEISEINDDFSDWAYEGKWIIESVRENYGFKIQLWFFKYDGLYDGMNCVTVTNINSEQPSAYGGDLNFNGRKFEIKLTMLIEKINKLRFDT